MTNIKDAIVAALEEHYETDCDKRGKRIYGQFRCVCGEKCGTIEKFNTHMAGAILAALAPHLAAHDAKVRLEETKWWTDPKRPNGPATLYPEEQQRIGDLERQAGGK